MTPSRIELATLRLVQQCLNQLPHRTPLISLGFSKFEPKFTSETESAYPSLAPRRKSCKSTYVPKLFLRHYPTEVEMLVKTTRGHCTIYRSEATAHVLQVAYSQGSTLENLSLRVCSSISVNLAAFTE